MNRLTKENSVGVHVFKSSYSCERCGEEFCRLPDLGNGSPTDKLAKYEIMEKKLEDVYGECDDLLEVVVDHLVKHPEIELREPMKSRLLTDKDVDKWDSFKHIPCKVGDILYCVIEDEREEDGYFISEEPIVEVGTRGIWLSSVIGEDSMDCFISYDEFGKDVFLNKEDIRR